MTSRQHLINFMDQLLTLMETNKHLYKKLILYRHQIKHVVPASFLEEQINLVRDQLQQRNFSFLSVELQQDIENFLQSCSLLNQSIIWKWIDLL